MSKVIIIDDDSMNRRMADMILKKQGIEVSQAGSGEEAIEKLSGESADLILLDIEMTGMDGFETYAKIRAIEGMSETPVVFLSGNEFEGTKEKALSLGAKDYIKKPFVPPVLVEIVKKYI